jgi:hypothetical protein
MSKRKGSVGELEVAKVLQAWWRDLEPEAIFKRTPQSGGWAKADARGAFQTSGDIVTDAREFPFSVEVKRREGFKWEQLLKGSRSPAWAWWRQAQSQAAESNLVPMLWIRKNRQGWWVMVPAFYVWLYNEICPLEDQLGGLSLVGWDGIAKPGVDYGEHCPLLFPATDFLDRDPFYFRRSYGHESVLHLGVGGVNKWPSRSRVEEKRAYPVLSSRR